MDATESLQVDTLQPTIVQPGDAVEVCGFPSLGADSRELEDAEFRKLASGPPPVPVEVTVAEALQGNYDNSLGTNARQDFRVDHEWPCPRCGG